MRTSVTSRKQKKAQRSQQDRKDEAERALLDAAEQLITQNGIEKTSLAQIGQLAGYSRGLVNHHFGSKNALLARLSERMQNDFSRAQRAQRRGNGLDKLLSTVDQYFRMKHARGTRGGTFFLIWANAINSGDNERFSATEVVVRDEIKQLLRSGLDDGSITSSVNPESLALIVISILRGIALQALIDPRRIKLMKERERVIEFLRDALTKQAS